MPLTATTPVLTTAGHKVEQNPRVLGPKNSDYKINGVIYDHYAPISSSPRSVTTAIKRKIVREQTERVVISLKDTSVSVKALKLEIDTYKIEGLKSLIVIDSNNTIINIY